VAVLLLALLFSVRDHAVVARAEQTFPSADGEGQDTLQFVVLCLVRPIHQARQQAKAAGVISGSAHAGLHEWSRDGIHLSKAGVGESFLGGKCIRGERHAESCEAESIASVKETVCERRRFELDKRGWWREQSVNRF
jgi:hypothetical protein